MSFKEINPFELKNESAFELIGKDWMLITAGDENKFNTMTASWGGLGVMWNKNVSFIFVRPQRYTMEFLSKQDYYTLSFFDDEYREALRYCGTNSGRYVNKILKTGLNTVFDSAPYFKEAKLVLICKKLYAQNISPEGFIDNNIQKNYPNNDYHKMFIGEVEKCLIKE